LLFAHSLVNYLFSRYIILMTITQTVEIPENRRLTIDIPREIPAGNVIISFTPAPIVIEKMSKVREKEIFNMYAEELNREMEDVLKYQIPIFEDEDSEE